MKKQFKYLDNLLYLTFSNQIINRLIINYSLALSILYLIIRIIDNVFLCMHGIGDEWFFIKDLNFYLDNGYYLSVLNGFSIPTTLISSWIYYLTGDISLSLRLTNTFIVFLLILYLFNREGLVEAEFKQFFTIIFFMLIGTMGGMFSGTNDSIFNGSLVIIFSELYLYFKNHRLNNIMMVIAITLCILSRPLFLIYLPITFLALFIFHLYRYGKINQSIINSISFNFSISLILVVLFNYPRIIEPNYSNGQGNHLTQVLFFSYSDKSGTYKTNDPDFNWAQWHFYSQMISNQNGRYLFAPLVKWHEVKEYKNNNTGHILPNSYQEYLINHTLSVIKRFPFSIIEIFLMSVRYLGFLLFLIPIWLYLKIKNKEDGSSIFLSILILLTIFALALICPRVVENRWLASVYVMVLILVTNKNNFINYILEQKYLMVNVIIMDIVTIWALWKWKIFLHL